MVHHGSCSHMLSVWRGPHNTNPINVGDSFGLFLNNVKSDTYRKGLIVTQGVIKLTTIFVMGDVKAVGGTVCVQVCVFHCRPANNMGICFAQGGLHLFRSQKKEIGNTTFLFSNIYELKCKNRVVIHAFISGLMRFFLLNVFSSFPFWLWPKRLPGFPSWI